MGAHTRIVLGGWLVALSVSSCITVASHSGEPAQRFLDAVREAGYFDTALDYLDQMEKSPLAPVAFKQVLDYERGLTLIAQAGSEVDLRARERLLDSAEVALQRFVQKDPNHRLALSARNQLGALLYRRGQLRIDQARRKQNDATLLAEARRFFDDAGKLFTSAQEDLRARLAPINNRRYTPAEREEEELREQLRRDYLQAQLLAAQVLEERAETFAQDSPEYRQALDEAYRAYQEIEKKYRVLATGLYARLAMARCMKKQEKWKEAIGFYTELLNESSLDELRDLKNEAILGAMDCWLQPSQKLFLEAINQATKWQDQLRPHELRDPLVLQVRYKLALAYKLYADSLHEQDPKNRQIGDLRRKARSLAIEVARFDSPVQGLARQLVADIRGVDVPEQERPEPKTFDDALRAAREAYDQMHTAEFLVRTLPERIAQETDAQIKADVQQQLQQAQQEVASKRDEALLLYRKALELANKETPVELLSVARVSLAHLLYLKGDYYDAAVLGEFLAVKYPAQSVARDAAAIGLASLVQLYTSANETEQPAAAARVRAFAERIINQWPDQPVAADAWNALLPFIVQDGDFERARRGIESIPETSPQRGEVELKLGRALWAAYRQGMVQLRQWQIEGAPPGIDLKEKQAQLEQRKQQAEQILEAGVNRVRQGGQYNESLLLSALALAQLYADTQQPAKAVALLEEPQIGPLARVRAKDPLAEKPGVAEETYRTALRAYLGQLREGSMAQSIDKVQEMMGELRQSLANVPDGNQRLVATYVGLARDLKGQLEIASLEERRKLVSAFEVFLKQIVAESKDFQVLNWAAETFFNLAESFDDPRSAIAPVTANNLYKQAITAYQTLLRYASENPSFLPDPRWGTLLQTRLALSQRRVGDYPGAIQTFLDILSKNNMALSVQVEAARTYQQWAHLPGKSQMLVQAIMGDHPDPNAKTPTNIIWGWGKIGKMTAGRKEFEDVFFESRLALAQCRFDYARSLPSDKKDMQDRYIELAKQDLWFTYRLYPELGGEKWKPAYDALLKEIQKAQGTKTEGLLEFQRRLAQSKPAS